MDPELAALLGTAGGGADLPPEFGSDTLDSNYGGQDNKEAHGVDLTSVGFPEVKKRLEAKPNSYFNDPNYYKTALSGEGDISKRVHGTLQKYLTAKDPKDRSVYRQQFIAPFWEFLSGIARKAPGNLLQQKKFLLRFGILHPTLLNAEVRNFFARVVVENELNQPVYYLDEWLKAVGTSAIRPSTTDEVKIARSNNQAKMNQVLEKAMGKLDGSRGLLRAKSQERAGLESYLRDKFQLIFEHTPVDEFEEASMPYTESQKRAFADIQELIKSLFRVDRELEISVRDFYQSESEVIGLRQKIEDEGASVVVDMGAIDTEFETIRQMAKMSVGRQGNHFPILTGEYFHLPPGEVGIRENVISLLARIESIDAEAFCRVHRNQLNRIVPYVILLPAYGDSGICWEPFDRFNRATSRSRIVIPMYPKNLYLAVLSAVADLRWQVCKEKASYYWMEEGLTGYYYQWFQSQKLKGDIKEFFIQDYITWMTKEAEGIQKLDKEVRGTFWRYMPFTKEVKERLRNRNLVYQELYQRDVNRSMSDGY